MKSSGENSIRKNEIPEEADITATLTDRKSCKLSLDHSTHFK